MFALEKPAHKFEENILVEGLPLTTLTIAAETAIVKNYAEVKWPVLIMQRILQRSFIRLLGVLSFRVSEIQHVMLCSKHFSCSLSLLKHHPSILNTNSIRSYWSFKVVNLHLVHFSATMALLPIIAAT
ncbi:hypothetical protein AAHA92_20986 [Salvia divinorum]|uniref:Uncharacterized protein n=1 Tax=Salvia divinorum TaxID=28513 RepID=A0ABD1GIZ2_SALDI